MPANNACAAIVLATACAWIAHRGRVHPTVPWNDVGHHVVALVAWEDLTPAARRKIGELLARHPRYEQDLLAGLAEGADAAATARHAFAMASSWPDTVRSPGHPLHATADHPVWHYVDIPYVRDGQTVPPASPKDKPGPHDILEALRQCDRDLAQQDLAAAERAVALCWFEHLVGDVHQPLHACTLYSAQFPEGDKGGNDLLVLREPPTRSSMTNLHHLWDSLPGTYRADELQDCLASGLRGEASLQRGRFAEALASKDCAAWADESHALAIKVAYLDGQLQGLPARELKEHPAQVPPGLPVGYLARAEKVAMRRLVLAGYRLADRLNAVFDPH